MSRSRSWSLIGSLQNAKIEAVAVPAIGLECP